MKEVLLKDQVVTDDYALYCGDCVEVAMGLPENWREHPLWK